MRRLGPVPLLLASLLLSNASLAGTRWDVEWIAGGGPDRLPAVEANLGGPVTVAIGNDGDLFIGTNETIQLFRVDASGLLHLLAQNRWIDTLAAQSLDPPTDMAVAPDGLVVIASEYGVLTWDPSTGELGRLPLGDSFWVTAVAVDSEGRVYFAEYFPSGSPWSGGTVRRYDPSDETLTIIAGKVCDLPWPFWCTYETGEGVPADEILLIGPKGLALDGQGNVYVTYGSRVRRIDLSDGTIWTVAGTESYGFSGDGGPATEAEFRGPRDVEFDSLGNLFITDAGNHRVRRVDGRSGIITTVAGDGEAGFSGDGGPATEASLDYPTSLAFDAAGNLYIADFSNRRVRRVDAATGRIATHAGNGTLYYSGDGYPARQASIWGDSMVVDAAGNLIIAESFTNRVRKVDAETGLVSTIAGTGEYSQEEPPDGVPATEAVVSHPSVIGFGPEGNLYLRTGEGGLWRVRVIDAQTGLISTIPGIALSLAFGPDGQAFTTVARQIAILDLQTGETTAIAGSGDTHYNGESVPAMEAGIHPGQVVVDPHGDLFFRDLADLQFRIRKLDRRSGLVETVAGAGSSRDGIFLGREGTRVGPALGILFDGSAQDLTLDMDGGLWFRSWWTMAARIDLLTGVARQEIGPGFWDSGSVPDPPQGDSDRLTPRALSIGADGALYVESGRHFYRLVDRNQVPVAIARGPGSVDCSSASGAKVTLDGSLSYDPDDLPGEPTALVSYWWYEDHGSPGERIIAKGSVADVDLSIGDHAITLVVRDEWGGSATDPIDVRIVDGEDPDGDGIGSCVDTCPEMPDPDQVDSDGNGLGDACDPCWQDAATDPDADGVCAEQDNCPELANADQADRDADGIGDACDLCPELFNPDQAAHESCLRVGSAVGECRSVTVDSAGEGRRGRVLFSGLERPVPGTLRLRVYHLSSEEEGDVFELYLNGGLLLSRPARTDPFGANWESFDIADAGLIASLWVVGGQNELRFVKAGSRTRVFQALVNWTEGDKSNGECLIGFAPCAAPSSVEAEPIDLSVTFVHDYVVKTRLSEVVYGPGPLSLSIDLPPEELGEFRLCVSATEPGGKQVLVAGTRAGELIAIDPFSGIATPRGFLPVAAADFDYDASTGSGYAVSSTDQFGVRFDIRDGLRTGPLVDVPRAYNSVQFADGVLFAGSSYGERPVWSYLEILDPDDGSLSDSGIDVSNGFMRGLAYSEADRDLWGSFSESRWSSSGAHALRRYDLQTKAEQTVGDVEVLIDGLAVGPDGLLYGVSEDDPGSSAGGELYWLDMDNAEATLVGDTGFTDVHALAFAGKQGAVDCIEFFHEGEQRLAINDSCGPPTAIVAPVADAECTSAEGATVALDGSASTDPNSSPGTHDGIVSFDWYVDYGTAGETHLGSGERLAAVLPFGTHIVTLRVTNRFGESATAATTITVVDTQPPAIAVTLDPETLWPPNHRMVGVSAVVTATDNCGSPAPRLVSVTSSEPDDAPGGGDGHTTGDIQGALTGAADLAFELRAERSGAGAGRVYEVVYEATDVAGASVQATARVVVPHSLGGVDEPVELSVGESQAGTVATWSEVAGAAFYHVVRGELGSIRLQGSSLDMGTVRCIESGSLDNSTEGFEDAAVPPAGEAFFYLVEFNDGWRYSAYGTESVGWPRLVAGDACR